MKNEKPRSKITRRKSPGLPDVMSKAAASVSVRGLRRDWRRVRAMVARGTTVVITDNGVPIMRLAAIEKPVMATIDWVAHLQKIQQIAGGKTTGDSAVLEERESYKW